MVNPTRAEQAAWSGLAGERPFYSQLRGRAAEAQRWMLTLVIGSIVSFMKKRGAHIPCYLLICCVFTACDGHTRVKGYVYDRDDNPIKDVLVRLNMAIKNSTSKLTKMERMTLVWYTALSSPA